MSAQIIDFMPYLERKRQEALEEVMEQIEFPGLSVRYTFTPDSDESIENQLTKLTHDLREHIILSAIARGDSVYPSDGHTTVMHNGMAWAIPDLKDNPTN